MKKHMSRGITKDDEVFVRLDYTPPPRTKAATRKHARVCDFTGRPMRGLLLLKAPGFKAKRSLERWISPWLEHTRCPHSPSRSRAPKKAAKAKPLKRTKASAKRQASHRQPRGYATTYFASSCLVERTSCSRAAQLS